MIRLPRLRPTSAPLALLLICLVAYIPMIYRLGFYWDDWPSIWFLHFWGPSGFQAGFASDRPLLAWVFMLTTPIFGESTIAWQYFSIFTRWLVSLAWWWTLSGLWPERPRQVFWTAVLLAVYPGFTQQYIAVTYSNAFLVFALFVLSFGSMIWAYRVRQSGDTKHRGDTEHRGNQIHNRKSSTVWFWLLITFSLLASAFSMFITEYFFGLELLRPVLLFMLGNTIYRGSNQSQGSSPGVSPGQERNLALRPFLASLWQVLLRWSPYLLIMIPFLIWRLFFNNSPRAQIILFDELKASLTSAGNLGRAVTPVLLGLARTIGGDFLEVNFLAWFHDLDLAYLHDFDASVIRLLLVSAFLSIAATALYLWMLQSNGLYRSPAELPDQIERETQNPKALDCITKDHWEYQAILLGVIAFLVSGWTIWITDLHFELLFPFDRFTMITMLGTSLLISGLVGLADRFRFRLSKKKNNAGGTRIPVASTILIAGLVGLSTVIQFQHRLNYRQEWLSQKAFFWQLLWRAPSLEPGTLVMTSEIPFTFYSDNSLTAPLNWIYDRMFILNYDQAGGNIQGTDMPYLLYDIEARLGQGLPAIEEDQAIRLSYRTTQFNGSTSKAIVLFYDPPRCVKVMNPELDRFLPVKPLYIREATPLSRLDLILAEPDPLSRPFPLAEIFGPEPAHAWCYYFEKAELYGQMGDWTNAAEMADQALKITKHFTEKNVSELIPFAMAYAHTGKWKKAVELSQNAYQIWDKTRYPFCDAWQNLSQETPDSQAKQDALEEIEQSLQCIFQ